MWTLLMLVAIMMYVVRSADVPCEVTVTSASGGLTTAQVNEILKAHNDVRKAVSPPAATMPLLQWNAKLAAYALRQMIKCPTLLVTSAATELQNLEGFVTVGENIAGGVTFHPSLGGPTKVVEFWAAEKKAYQYKENICQNVLSGCADYTQIVWATTTEVGCGYSACLDQERMHYWQCNYGEAGNQPGMRPYVEGLPNSLPPCVTQTPTPNPILNLPTIEPNRPRVHMDLDVTPPQYDEARLLVFMRSAAKLPNDAVTLYVVNRIVRATSMTLLTTFGNCTIPAAMAYADNLVGASPAFRSTFHVTDIFAVDSVGQTFKPMPVTPTKAPPSFVEKVETLLNDSAIGILVMDCVLFVAAGSVTFLFVRELRRQVGSDVNNNNPSDLPRYGAAHRPEGEGSLSRGTPPLVPPPNPIPPRPRSPVVNPVAGMFDAPGVDVGSPPLPKRRPVGPPKGPPSPRALSPIPKRPPPPPPPADVTPVPKKGKTFKKESSPVPVSVPVAVTPPTNKKKVVEPLPHQSPPKSQRKRATTTTTLPPVTVEEMVSPPSMTMTPADNNTVPDVIIYSTIKKEAATTLPHRCLLVGGRGIEGQLGMSSTAVKDSFVIHEELSASPIVRVFTGGYHSFVLLQDSTLLGFGDNTQGQIGVDGHPSAVARPTPVQLPFGCEVINVHCGESHTIVVTNVGLYAFGSNTEGQLGIEAALASLSSPTRVPFPKHVSSVAVGSHHTIVVCDNDSVYAFGYNDCGQLMLGDTTARRSPTPVPDVQGSSVLHMACGVAHTILHCRNGVFAAGESRLGQLGIGDRAKGQCVVVPAHVHYFDCMVEDIRGVSAWFHTVFWTSTGVFVCGEGAKGKLGLGDNADRAHPAQVPCFADGKRQILKVVAGAEHTTALTSDGVFGWGMPLQGTHGLETLKDGYDPATPVRLTIPRVGGASIPPEVLDMDTKLAHTLLLVSNK